MLAGGFQTSGQAAARAQNSRNEERARLATVASLRPFFHPRVVAVVGASGDPASIGQRLLDAVLSGGFTGAVYAVNPRATEVLGL